MPNHKIEKLIEETIQSFDGSKRAEPKPFLLTRVMAAVNNGRATQNVWTKAAAFISRPVVALSGISLIVLLNISIYFISKSDTDMPGMVQNSAVGKDEFAINAASIYDFENAEQ